MGPTGSYPCARDTPKSAVLVTTHLSRMSERRAGPKKERVSPREKCPQTDPLAPLHTSSTLQTDTRIRHPSLIGSGEWHARSTAAAEDARLEAGSWRRIVEPTESCPCVP